MLGANYTLEQHIRSSNLEQHTRNYAVEQLNGTVYYTPEPAGRAVKITLAQNSFTRSKPFLWILLNVVRWIERPGVNWRWLHKLAPYSGQSSMYIGEYQSGALTLLNSMESNN